MKWTDPVGALAPDGLDGAERIVDAHVVDALLGAALDRPREGAAREVLAAAV